MKPKPAADSAETTLTPELMARVRQIQIRTHGLVSAALQGAYRSSFRGTGIEFEEVRPYMPGDEVRSIDWNVTARTGEPHIKTYVEERQLIVQLVVDTSRSMDFGSVDKTKREAAAEVCALLAFVAAGQQDQIGLCLFADEPGLHLEPDKGTRHVLRVVREVMAARTSGVGSSLAGVLEHQLLHLKRRSLVLVVSDFLGVENEDWQRPLAHLARKHDVICVRVTDPFEERLPKSGLLLFEEIESGRTIEIDTASKAVREDWQARARQRAEHVLRTVRRARADLVEVTTGGDPAEPIVRLFRRRAQRGGGVG